MSIAELRKELKTENMVFGTERTIKFLKNGKLKKIYLSKNCPEDLKKDISHYEKISGVEIEVLEETNEDLGVICKKPFMVSVLSILK